MRAPFLIAAFFCAAPFLATQAQTIFEVPMTGAALANLDANGLVQGCGIRVIGIQEFGRGTRLFDVSLNLDKTGHALGKLTGSVTGPLSPGKTPMMKNIPVLGGWFRVPGQPATRPKTGFADGEVAGTKLFITDFSTSLGFMDAALSHAQVQIGISWESGYEAIYAGVVEIEDGQSRQFQGCMAELVSAMERGLK